MIFLAFLFLGIDEVAVQIEEPFTILPMEVCTAGGGWVGWAVGGWVESARMGLRIGLRDRRVIWGWVRVPGLCHVQPCSLQFLGFEDPMILECLAQLTHTPQRSFVYHPHRCSCY